MRRRMIQIVKPTTATPARGATNATTPPDVRRDPLIKAATPGRGRAARLSPSRSPPSRRRRRSRCADRPCRRRRTQEVRAARSRASQGPGVVPSLLGFPPNRGRENRDAAARRRPGAAGLQSGVVSRGRLAARTVSANGLGHDLESAGGTRTPPPVLPSPSAWPGHISHPVQTNAPNRLPPRRRARGESPSKTAPDVAGGALPAGRERNEGHYGRFASSARRP
jgi:hypothetical protein